MQTIYVPKYNLHYRVNPRNSRELQWSRKPFGPATQWQHAMTFRNPIRALDRDDRTGQGVVVLNDSTTYIGSGVRTWGRKFYPVGTRIYSLYAIGESNMPKMKIKVHETYAWEAPFNAAKAEASENCKKLQALIDGSESNRRDAWGCVGSMKHLNAVILDILAEFGL